MRVKIDLQHKVWSGAVGASLIAPQPLSTKSETLGLGSLSPTWWGNPAQGPNTGGPVAGDNRMVFDDLEIDWSP